MPFAFKIQTNWSVCRISITLRQGSSLPIGPGVGFVRGGLAWEVVDAYEELGVDSSRQMLVNDAP